MDFVGMNYEIILNILLWNICILENYPVSIGGCKIHHQPRGQGQDQVPH